MRLLTLIIIAATLAGCSDMPANMKICDVTTANDVSRAASSPGCNVGRWPDGELINLHNGF